MVRVLDRSADRWTLELSRDRCEELLDLLPDALARKVRRAMGGVRGMVILVLDPAEALKLGRLVRATA